MYWRARVGMRVNGSIQVPAPLWRLLFGGFYFAVKGVWTHAVAGLLLAMITFELSWINWGPETGTL